jgi:serine/threonine protein kinase
MNRVAENQKVDISSFVLLKVPVITWVQLLGRGSFGKVLLVQSLKNDKLYAMKIIRKDVLRQKGQELHVLVEKEILSKVDHPFLV